MFFHRAPIPLSQHQRLSVIALAITFFLHCFYYMIHRYFNTILPICQVDNEKNYTCRFLKRFLGGLFTLGR